MDQRDALLLLLKSAGFAARAYGSAEAFLADHTPGLTGCVLADVRLPGMDGVGLVNALNRRGNQLPVIVISGYTETPLVVEAMRAGAVDVQEKPLDPPLLLASVRAAIGGAGGAASLRSEVAAAAAGVAWSRRDRWPQRNLLCGLCAPLCDPCVEECAAATKSGAAGEVAEHQTLVAPRSPRFNAECAERGAEYAETGCRGPAAALA
ncbi:response regulator transcription factor, partial [Rhodopila globiformis]|uniref:response regulator transcription factor n=1 Tax=Rhodopila globiformis TaxID=1071 RepID=UPI0013049582